VTFGFVDAGWFPVESSGVGISPATSRFQTQRPRSSPAESCGSGYHSVPPRRGGEIRSGASCFHAKGQRRSEGALFNQQPRCTGGESCWNCCDKSASVSRRRVPRAELDRIHFLDANLAQSLRALVVSKPKLEDAAPSGQLHVAIGVEAKARNERASGELALWSMHLPYVCPVGRSELGTVTALSDASSPVRSGEAGGTTQE
jgi:hypothetical protein